MRRTVALVAAALLLPGLAAAMTGRELMQSCQGAADRLAGCNGFLTGFVAAYDLAVEDGKELGWFCLPNGYDPAVLRNNFLDWARENPGALDQPAPVNVKTAFQEAFSCTE